MKLKFFLIALKRMIKMPSYFICLICLFGAILFSSLVGQNTGNPQAGVVNCDSSEEAKILMKQLVEKSYVPCNDEEELRQRVEQGELNCGLIIKQGLEKRMQAGDIKGALVFVSSPLTYMPEIYLGYAQSSLFSQYVPYLTSELLKDTGLTFDEVKMEYDNMINAGLLFEFDIQNIDGDTISTKHSKANGLLMSAISVFVFMVLFTSSVFIIHKDVRPMIARIGERDATKYILLPSVIIQMLLCILCAVLPLCILIFYKGQVFAVELILPAILYAVVITQIGLLIASLLRDSRDMYLLLPFLLLGTLALCPIFTDISIFIPIIRGMRVFIPTYWFWLIKDNPNLFIIVTIVLFIFQYIVTRNQRLNNRKCMA